MEFVILRKFRSGRMIEGYSVPFIWTPRGSAKGSPHLRFECEFLATTVSKDARVEPLDATPVRVRKIAEGEDPSHARCPCGCLGIRIGVLSKPNVRFPTRC